MVFAMVREKMTYYNCMSNVRPHAYHNIHQTTDCGGIWYLFHSFLLFLSCGALCWLEFKVVREWNVDRLTLSHVKSLKYFLNLFFSWDNHNLVLALSLVIFIPRIFLASSKSFRAKDLLRSLFSFAILLVSRPTINISSTYKNRMTKSPSENFLTNMKWSMFVLLYPWCKIKESNFLYQSLGACFKPYLLFFNLHTKFSFPLIQIPRVDPCKSFLPNHHEGSRFWHPVVQSLYRDWLWSQVQL